MILYGFVGDPTTKQARKVVRAMARAEGCNCHPNIGKPQRWEDGQLHIRISHDDWCQLLQRHAAEWN